MAISITPLPPEEIEKLKGEWKKTHKVNSSYNRKPKELNMLQYILIVLVVLILFIIGKIV